MELLPDQSLQADQSLPDTAKRVKQPYQTPILMKLGGLSEITRNTLPGSTSDVLGSGFDPDPFSS